MVLYEWMIIFSQMKYFWTIKAHKNHQLPWSGEVARDVSTGSGRSHVHTTCQLNLSGRSDGLGKYLIWQIMFINSFMNGHVKRPVVISIWHRLSGCSLYQCLFIFVSTVGKYKLVGKKIVKQVGSFYTSGAHANVQQIHLVAALSSCPVIYTRGE